MQSAPQYWTEQVDRVLHGYDEGLLRKVAVQLFRPRNSWPASELIERTLNTLNNPPALDRRLKDLEPGPRALLVLIARSRQARWPVSSLVEMMVALGEADGLAPLMALLETGLLYPETSTNGEPVKRLKSFEQWLSSGSPTTPPMVFVHPAVVSRIREEKLPFPEAPAPVHLALHPTVQEADGFEWLLRLSALWQTVRQASLRRTQQGDLFKRDLDKLRGDPLLSSRPGDGLVELADPGLLTLCWALKLNLVRQEGIEIHADSPAHDWMADLPRCVAALWSSLFQIRDWNAEKGWQPFETPAHPFPAAYLLGLVMLGHLAEDEWARPQDVEEWMLAHHPYWKERETPSKPKSRGKAEQSAAPGPMVSFLLSVAYPMRLLQATKNEDGWLVRLSTLGKWVLGLVETVPPQTVFPQTVLVQPNLEILAYRQGLSPSLLFRLGKFATWKTIGAACTLQLEPDSVYRAMEGGETAGGILQLLEAHGMKGVPAAVVESLKTWSNKRDRITLYPTGALLEFPGAAELTEALARGLPAVRLGERLALVPTEKDIDYRHFRLIGTRDYHLPPEKCVEVEADGVTLKVDLARSDLLLETEILRFAEAQPGPRNVYRITPASTAAARNAGLTLNELETWFSQRTSGQLSPAARLLMAGCLTPPGAVRKQLVLQMSASEWVEGLVQWPGTRTLIQERLGPQTVTILEENLPALRMRLAEIGMSFEIVE